MMSDTETVHSWQDMVSCDVIMVKDGCTVHPQISKIRVEIRPNEYVLAYAYGETGKS